MAPKSKKSEYPAFTNFTIKVAERSWARTVTRLLKNVEGVTNFKTEGDGKINISGYIEPALLLKCLMKLGKSAQVEQWQYGECSNNMYVKKQEPTTNKNANINGYDYPRYGGYNGYDYPRYGGYNGYDYPRYEGNYGYNRLECAGNASDCNGHHIEKPKTPEKAASASSSSSSVFKKLSSVTSCFNGANCAV